MRSVHVLDRAQLDLVELLLTGCLAPRTGFSADLPLQLPVCAASAGDDLELRDLEGVPVAYVQVEIPAPAVTGKLVSLAGVSHDDALDLRWTPQRVRELAGGRPAIGALLRGPLQSGQANVLAAAARTKDADLVLLCPLGAHDVGDADWFARAAAARAGGELLRQALSDSPAQVTVVAVPPAPRPELERAMLAAYGVEPVALPDDPGTVLAPVAAQRARFDRVGADRGAVLFFTGLSGSGKSTIAKAVAAHIMETGQRRVTLLDGDVVRRHLSSELTFSPEHRDLNVRRIGWVAAEVARHGGTAVACPIAPYDGARRAAREMTEQTGAVFLLVHVATPLEVCEQRDRKGLYALARAGTIPNFTGVSDPYEVPVNPDMRLDTAQTPLPECVEHVLSEMRRHLLLS